MGAGRTWRAIFHKRVLMSSPKCRRESEASQIETAEEMGRVRESVTARCAHPDAPVLSLDN
jgi:hypothetical protein